MHPNNPQELEFSLEDILKEFSDSAADDLLQEFLAEPDPEPEAEREQLPVWQPASEPMWQPVPIMEEPMMDTVRIEPIAVEPVKHLRTA